jgi:hypothetical protein
VFGLWDVPTSSWRSELSNFRAEYSTGILLVYAKCNELGSSQ